MATVESGERAYVVYRAAGRGDRPVEVHLVMAADAATVGDAWTRLTRLDPSVDPRSLENETRRLASRPRATAAGEPSPPVDIAHWLAARAAMPHDGRHEGQRRDRVHS